MSEKWKKLPKIYVWLLIFDWGSKLIARSVGWYQVNSGVGMGLLNGLPNLVIVVSFLILAWLLFSAQSVALKLILVGGVANFADRLINGQVTDWILLPVVKLWLNPADIFITLGVLMYLFGEFKIKQDENSDHI